MGAGQTLGATGWFGIAVGPYAVDLVTFTPGQGDYPVNLNHVPVAGVQDDYQVEQVHRNLLQQHHIGEAIRAVR